MNDELKELHLALGYQSLNRFWAKIEIVGGLLVAGLGLFLGDWAVSSLNAEVHLSCIAAGLCLFTLGGYLALAGHRSHLYQSNNELTAYLMREIRRLQAKG